MESYSSRYGQFPTIHAFCFTQAIYALKTAYEKAIQKAGRWPTTEEVAKALEYLEFDSPDGHMKMALGNGHQAIQAVAYGTTTDKLHPRWGFPLHEQVLVFPAEKINPPPGMKTLDWIKTQLTR